MTDRTEAQEATLQPADPAEDSWRGSVPTTSAADLENLLGTGVGAAQEQLERNGGFLPFALVVENDGDVRLVAVTPGIANGDADGAVDGDAVGTVEGVGAVDAETDFDADGMISDLTELLRQHRDEFRAAAIVCDITLLDEDSDAIHVAAEHQDGSVFAAVMPYGPAPTADGLAFGELAADSNEPAVWVD